MNTKKIIAFVILVVIGILIVVFTNHSDRKISTDSVRVNNNQSSSSVTSSYDKADYVFTGRVIRQVQTSDVGDSVYEVKINSDQLPNSIQKRGNISGTVFVVNRNKDIKISGSSDLTYVFYVNYDSENNQYIVLAANVYYLDF